MEKFNITNDLFVRVTTQQDIKSMVASYHDTHVNCVMFAANDVVLVDDTAEALLKMSIQPLPFLTLSEVDIPMTSGFSAPIVKGIHIKYRDIEETYGKIEALSLINERINWCATNKLSVIITDASWSIMKGITDTLEEEPVVLFVADLSDSEGQNGYMDSLIDAIKKGIPTGLIVGLRDIDPYIGGAQGLAHTFAPDIIKNIGLGSKRPVIIEDEIERLYSMEVVETVMGLDTSMVGENIITMIAGGYSRRTKWNG